MSYKIFLRRSTFWISWQCKILLSISKFTFSQLTLLWTASNHTWNIKDYVANCYAKIKSTLLLAAKGEAFDEHILAICSFYGDDLDQHNLYTQLTLLGTLFDGLDKDRIDISYVINRLPALTQLQKNLFSEIRFLLKIYLVAPATTVISEYSCSTLRITETFTFALQWHKVEWITAWC